MHLQKREDDYGYSQLPPKEMPSTAKMIFDDAKKLHQWILDSEDKTWFDTEDFLDKYSRLDPSSKIFKNSN